jgi:hypothetical protein
VPLHRRLIHVPVGRGGRSAAPPPTRVGVTRTSRRAVSDTGARQDVGQFVSELTARLPGSATTGSDVLDIALNPGHLVLGYTAAGRANAAPLHPGRPNGLSRPRTFTLRLGATMVLGRARGDGPGTRDRHRALADSPHRFHSPWEPTG